MSTVDVEMKIPVPPPIDIFTASTGNPKDFRLFRYKPECRIVTLRRNDDGRFVGVSAIDAYAADRQEHYPGNEDGSDWMRHTVDFLLLRKEQLGYQYVALLPEIFRWDGSPDCCYQAVNIYDLEQLQFIERTEQTLLNGIEYLAIRRSDISWHALNAESLYRDVFPELYKHWKIEWQRATDEQFKHPPEPARPMSKAEICRSWMVANIGETKGTTRECLDRLICMASMPLDGFHENDRRVYLAMLRAAYKAGVFEINRALRSICLDTGLSKSTVAMALASLHQNFLVVRIFRGSENRSAKYLIALLDYWETETFLNATQRYAQPKAKPNRKMYKKRTVRNSSFNPNCPKNVHFEADRPDRRAAEFWRAMGIQAGAIYLTLGTQALPAQTIARDLQVDRRTVAAVLRRLETFGLSLHVRGGWTRGAGNLEDATIKSDAAWRSTERAVKLQAERSKYRSPRGKTGETVGGVINLEPDSKREVECAKAEIQTY